MKPNIPNRKPRTPGIPTPVRAADLARVVGGHWGVGNGLTEVDAAPAALDRWGVGNG